MIELSQVFKVNHCYSHVTDTTVAINALSWFPNNKLADIPLYKISPYYLKTEDGFLFENYWQSGKVYPQIFNVDDGYGFTFPGGPGLDSNQGLTEHYLNWRRAVLTHPNPVRYPNTYHGRHTCCGAVFMVEGKFRFLDYLNARKEVYVPYYQKLVDPKIIDQICELAQDKKIIIYERDVPNISYSDEAFNQYLNDTSRAFGHGWVLAKMLNMRRRNQLKSSQ